MAAGRRPRSSSPLAAWRHVDLLLVAATAGILAMSLLMIYSSTRQRQLQAGLDPAFFVKRQAMFVGVGIVALVLITLVHYEAIRNAVPVIFGGSLLMLLLVLTPLGTERRGTQAWFQLGPYQFEPSEVAKLALIVTLAAYCANERGALDPARLVTALGLAAAPLVLIYLQPDIGTGMVFVAIVMGLLLVGGATARQIGVLTLLGLTAIVAVLQLGVLKDYQRDRLAAFLDPKEDVQRTAYNLNQSKIAIAAGGLGGRGLFQGTQTNLSFVPEQHTDFIFTAVGEELGFAGAVTLLGLFALVIWRTWRTAAEAKDEFGRLLCVGVLCMLVFQVFENVGMTMGITPIAGIPLPLMSYGGSATVATLMAVGLVLNVHMRRFS
ncbi:MAG: rod shape-determining protein RodA [Actinomycetota bacterium]|nr:rod shape-determining protein RodA [Actinomycetota bacterium]